MGTKLGGAIQGDFPSLKLGRNVTYQSSIERDILYLFEYEQAIERYQEQPFVIEGLYEGKQHQYTPDYAIWRGEDCLLIECKPTAKRNTDHTRQQQILGEQWCRDHDWIYEIVTEEDLRSGYSLANVKLLWRYSRLQPTAQDYFQLGNLKQPTALAECSKWISIPIILHFVFHHEITLDIHKPITPQSIMHPKGSR